MKFIVDIADPKEWSEKNVSSCIECALFNELGILTYTYNKVEPIDNDIINNLAIKYAICDAPKKDEIEIRLEEQAYKAGFYKALEMFDLNKK